MTVRTAGSERPTPDWSLWLQLPRMALWKAVALSLDLEPDRLEISPNAWMSGPGGPVAVDDKSFNTKAQAAEFSKRRRIAAARLTGDERNDRAEGPLADFLRLAIELEWTLPDQLANARPPQAAELESQPPAPRVPRKVLVLPAGTNYVPFGELKELIADAKYPYLGPGDERLHFGAAQLTIHEELMDAVRDGSLPVLDPLTYGPNRFPFGAALLRAMVDVDDLRNWLHITYRMTVVDSGANVGELPGEEPRRISTPDAESPRDVASEQHEKSPAPDRGRCVKREALVADNIRRWPTIERDLRDASENGLSSAARANKRGWWWEGSAQTWADERGKLEAVAPSLSGTWPSTIHKMKG